MAHFAYIVDGVVERVERVEDAVILDADGNESEAVGQAFLASLYPGTDPADFVQTSVTDSMRGTFAGIGYTFDPTADAFAPPPDVHTLTDADLVTLGVELAAVEQLTVDKVAAVELAAVTLEAAPTKGTR